MFKKIFLLSAVALLFATVALAQQVAPPPSEETTPPAQIYNETKITPIEGTIDKIDPEAKTITLKVIKDGKEEMKVYTFTDKSTFWAKDEAMKEKSLTAKDLKVGDKVSLEADSLNVITKLTVGSHKDPMAEESTEPDDE